jgi:electron transport complex protein RnfA
MEFLSLIIGLVFVNNYVLARFIGLCPFIGVSKKTHPAVSMGMAVTFVLTMDSFVTFPLYTYFIQPGPQNVFYSLTGTLGMPAAQEFIRANGLGEVLTIGTFILIIAALVQLVEMVIRKTSKPLYDTLGIYLPLITTNCIVLAVPLNNIAQVKAGGDWFTKSFPEGLLWATVSGFVAGMGFLLVMLLMSGVRERLAVVKVPKPFQGVPIVFISASLMALAFFGFAGMMGGLKANFG